MDGVLLGVALLALSLIPLAYLVYTLLNLEKLSMPLNHPRVIVEAVIFLLLLLVGLYLRLRE